MIQSFSHEAALVLTSGGQDSTTCLFWALKNFASVQAISFFYSQKHAIEVETAREICDELKIPFKLVDISFMKDLVVSNLFQGTADVNQGSHPQDDKVPSTFVPYRNLLFLTLASGWAGTINTRHLVTGVCETDYSGYADCRDVFIKSAQSTLNLASDFKNSRVVIHTPLMWLTKAEEFRMAQELGCLDFIIQRTLTCYNGDKTMNDYGFGCGQCPACKLRAKGYQEFRERYL
ncbi:MAG: 7-cyano-7-deazaguanine synthase QueC [Spirochaetales bacterium]|nr:7-cyano-7-deazaguanine synthase QueC [Spirochaetales bacterium]